MTTPEVHRTLYVSLQKSHKHVIIGDIYIFLIQWSQYFGKMCCYASLFLSGIKLTLNSKFIFLLSLTKRSTSSVMSNDEKKSFLKTETQISMSNCHPLYVLGESSMMHYTSIIRLICRISIHLIEHLKSIPT